MSSVLLKHLKTIMKKQIQILAILLLSLFVFSCDDDNDNNDTCCHGSSIVDVASQEDSLSNLK